MFIADADELPNLRFLEQNIQSLFLNLRVLYNGKEIQNIYNYCQLCHLIDDASKSLSERYSDEIDYLALERVLDNSLTLATSAVGTGTPADATYTTTISLSSALNNDLFNAGLLGISPQYDESEYDFGISLKTLFGSGCNRPIPLHLFNKGDITLEFTLNSPYSMFVAADNGNAVISYVLSNFQYEACISEIPLQVSKLLYPQNVCNLMINDYTYESHPIPAGSTSVNIEMNQFDYNNLKNVFFFFSNLSSRNSRTKFFTSQRLQALFTNFYLENMGKHYPKHNISNDVQMYLEVKKAFNNQVGNLTSATYNINANAYTTASDLFDSLPGRPPASTLHKRFIGCINLYRYTDVHNYSNGLNTKQGALYLRGDFLDATYNTPHAITEKLQLVTFSNFTSVLQIVDGEMIILS